MHPVIEQEREEILAYINTLPEKRQRAILRMAKEMLDEDIATAIALALVELKAKVKA